MNGMAPRVGLNLIPEQSFRVAAMPLFEDGLVDALEWDIDERWGGGRADRRIPRWVDQLLDVFADDDALYGHGVWFSILSARWEARQDRWLACLAGECARRRYRHVSEHFGFMTAGEFEQSTLLPVPYLDAAVRVGVDRLRRIAAAARVPVGLENLAAALGPRDALDQGRFLDDVLAPVGGFLLLDVHNLWTQAVNLGLDAMSLLDGYPLHRVREIHVSGGGWYEARSGGRVRLDSHDGPVPEAELYPLLGAALARCPNLEVVFFERRGATLDTDVEVERWRRDYRAVRQLVENTFALQEAAHEHA